MRELEELASEMVKCQGKANRELALKKHLKRVKDVEGLRELANKYTPHVEVSIPINERILELNPDDVDAIVALGFLFWLDGEDSKAGGQVKRARKINAGHVGMLTLEAALTKNRNTKVRLYKRVLEVDLGNQVARENLKELGVSGNSI